MLQSKNVAITFNHLTVPLRASGIPGSQVIEFPFLKYKRTWIFRLKRLTPGQEMLQTGAQAHRQQDSQKQFSGLLMTSFFFPSL